MRFAMLLVALAALTAFQLTQSESTRKEFPISQQDIIKIVDRHNYWRAEVNVDPIEWSDEMAEVAAKWARELKKDGCAFYHSDYGFGENLWKGTTGYYSIEEAIDSWASEKADYNYSSNKCRRGKVCGHYTQIVWANTQKVGCAQVTCDGYTIWVCEYDPPGNWVGQRPY
ncbi:MAG: pathogenesis-related family 1 protein [Bacteroidota bacterium]